MTSTPPATPCLAAAGNSAASGARLGWSKRSWSGRICGSTAFARAAADDRTPERPLRAREQRRGRWRSFAFKPRARRTPSSPRELAPVLLVFRDGHSEEVRDYTIAEGILYATGNYYTDGYWNKKIALSTLNVAQTLEANATRNVKFVLPESSNEVITRP